MTVHFLGFFYFNGYRVIFPLILERMGFNQIEVVANWATIYGFGLFISSLTRYPMGIISDRLTRSKTLTLAFILITTPIIGMYFTNNVILLAILFGFMRTGTHLPPLLTRGYVNETEKSKQGTLNGFFSFFSNLGGFVGPILFTFFLEVSLLNLIIFSNLIILVFYIFYLLKIPPKMTKNTIPTYEFVSLSLKELFNKFKKIILLFTILGFVNGAINYLQAPYALYVLHLSAGDTSLIIGLVLLITTLIIIFAGRLTDRFGIRLSIYIALVLIIIGSVIQILNETDVFYYFLSQIFLNEGVLLGTNTLITHITLHSKSGTTSSIFGGASSFFFFGSALVAEIVHILYVSDPLLPYWFLIGISAIVFPFSYIFNMKNGSSSIPTKI